MEYNTKPKTGHKGRVILAIIAVICLIIFAITLSDGSLLPNSNPNSGQNSIVNQEVLSTTTATHSEEPDIIATNLKIPWDIAFLPDGSLLVTERVGNLVHIETKKNASDYGVKTSIKLPHPVPKGEGGLLGMTLHPDFANNKFLYLYMTTQNLTQGTKNTVFRYRYENSELKDEKTIVSNIPGALYHDGGRLAFGPDKLLYITTGDAQTPSNAQDLKSLSGKILRVEDDGSIPKDNPFGTAVYSYGHRNPQGLAWDHHGRLWSTEHGRSGLTSGMDEINLIEKGGNYGWPTIEGSKTKTGMKVPVMNSGPDVTWAPASAIYANGSLFFGGLRGEVLYEAVLDEDEGKIKELRAYFHNTYGRIRTVNLGPDGALYFTTSNTDGRGKPIKDDDRIVRIDINTLGDHLEVQ